MLSQEDCLKDDLDLRSINPSDIKDDIACKTIIDLLTNAYNATPKEERKNVLQGFVGIVGSKLSSSEKAVGLIRIVSDDKYKEFYLNNKQINDFVNAALVRSLEKGSPIRLQLEKYVVNIMAKLKFVDLIRICNGLKEEKKLDMGSLKNGRQHYRVNPDGLFDNISRTRTFMIGMFAQYGGSLFFKHRSDMFRYLGGKENFLKSKISLVYLSSDSSGKPKISSTPGVRALDDYPEENDVMKAYLVDDPDMVNHLESAELNGNAYYGYTDVIQRFKRLNNLDGADVKLSPDKPKQEPKREPSETEDNKAEPEPSASEKEKESDNEESDDDDDSDDVNHTLRACLAMVSKHR